MTATHGTTPAAAAAAAAPAPAPAPAPSSIGMATQEPDGTIVLTLRADGPDGAVGDTQFRYPPGDKDYRMIQAHVGPIPAGKSVPVKPFPGE